MQIKRLSRLSRILLIITGVVLIAVLFIPMWRIDLQAPQYPEGLRLLIYPNKLAGSVDIINGLNHYIGMKTLHTEDFFEFTILPYCIIFFIVSFILVGISGRRKLLNFLFILFVLFGILAMYDFWRWEYNYGHNLNPDAAIIVPGMAYQPPLIGFKQLLNFGAYSVPDIGGWLFVSAGVVLLFCVIKEYKNSTKKTAAIKASATVAALLFLLSLSSCNAGPQPVVTGTDHCSFCKMTIIDNRFGAELLTKKGKAFKFDDVHCLQSFLASAEVKSTDIKDIYLVDFCETHQLINLKQSMLLKSDQFKTPMAGNVAAFSNEDSLKKIQPIFNASKINWTDLNNK